MDLKSLALKFTSLSIANDMIATECLKTCRRGVKTCDQGLDWPAAYDYTIEQFKCAHAEQG